VPRIDGPGSAIARIISGSGDRRILQLDFHETKPGVPEEMLPHLFERFCLVIDDEQHTATYRGQKLELTPVEFRLLNTLYGNKGRVFSRDQLMNKLYQDYRVVTDRTVDSHIKNLRRKLDQVSPDHELIRSIYGIGYKFEA
jgi:DNA-binding response OmpR family regulator